MGPENSVSIFNRVGFRVAGASLAGAAAVGAGAPLAAAVFAPNTVASANAEPGAEVDPLVAEVTCNDPTSNPNKIGNIVITVTNTTADESKYTVGVDPGTYSRKFSLAPQESKTVTDSGVANGDYAVIVSGGDLIAYSKPAHVDCKITTDTPTPDPSGSESSSGSGTPTGGVGFPEGACTVTDHGQDNCPKPDASDPVATGVGTPKGQGGGQGSGRGYNPGGGNVQTRAEAGDGTISTGNIDSSKIGKGPILVAGGMLLAAVGAGVSFAYSRRPERA